MNKKAKDLSFGFGHSKTPEKLQGFISATTSQKKKGRIYSDRTYVLVRYKNAMNETVTMTGFAKDDNGITFKLDFAKIIGGKSFTKQLPFSRKEIHFMSIETIS